MQSPWSGERFRAKRLALAVSGVAGLASAAAAQTSLPPEAQRAIETIVVTASKRSEDIQDVAIPVQAITGEGLRDLGVETFDEYVNLLPNVANAGNGPGKKDIYPARQRHRAIRRNGFHATGLGTWCGPVRGRTARVLRRPQSRFVRGGPRPH